ncbi:sugar ABC transporter ATP-binding protein [Nocardioides flavescens]|uniref:ATP-binding cassette domain-containing protein n=1 Tax=Nocardioides flavescens TaxID=2691959 RepID=A0A6L7EZX7_9ACTN|nr:sugar ABC transporter ATP-binding protein [Nocardioides flavescens]MXG89252.1 ATP-binding cassette domain-containing protein [Nocardioides flavescens]
MRVRCSQLVKVFPGVRALDGVDLDLRPGTVHALLGENGAGKSTLIKVLTGVHRADGGTVTLGEDGETRTVAFSRPLDAQAAGIGVVHQERNLVPSFSVAENIALQALPRRAGVVDRAAVRDLARRCLAQLDLDLDVDQPVAELSVAHMQLVEIAKALATDSQVLLLDEPTASLTADEADRLYAVVRRLREQGHVVVLVTHKLEEVFAIADVVTVLRDGRSVAGSVPLATLTRGDVVDLMVGRAHTELELSERSVDRAGTPALELRGVSTSVGHRGIDLAVHRGEIVGLYGLVGAGRSELVRALLGLDSVTGGEVLVDGDAVTIRSVGDALRRHRIGYVTENRKEEGVFLTQNLARNVAVTVWDRLARFGLVRDRDEKDLLATYRDRLGIRLSGPDQLAGQLSGGNQQKISLAKWLAADCSVLVVDEPTVGIDVRTKAAFHELIVELADQGLAILLITSDLPEMVTLADRVAVMHERRITGELLNSHHYTSMSAQVIRLVHGESAVDDPPAA